MVTNIKRAKWFDSTPPEYTAYEMAFDSLLTTLHEMSDGDISTGDSKLIKASIDIVIQLIEETGIDLGYPFAPPADGIDADEQAGVTFKNIIKTCPWSSKRIIGILKAVTDNVPSWAMEGVFGEATKLTKDLEWDELPDKGKVFLFLSYGVKDFQVKHDPSKPQQLDMKKYYEIVKLATLAAEEAGLETFYIGGVAFNATYAKYLIEYTDKQDRRGRKRG